MSLLAGLDIGSTTVKAVLLDSASGLVVRQSSLPTPTHHPRPDWSEHDPLELFAAAAACLREICQGVHPAAVSISSFAEAGLPLDAAGEPLHPIVSWFDRRCQPQADRWDEWIDPAELHAISGQRSSPSFGVNKLLWFIENCPEQAARMSAWLSTPDYLFFRLTGSQATDRSIASRTMLFDQTALDWSPRLMALAGISPSLLPPVYPSGTHVGVIRPEAAALTGLPAGTPCVLGGHDHPCAAFAAGLYQPGRLVDSIGTAEALMLSTSSFISSAEIARQAFSCYAHLLEGQYIYKGGLKLAGGAIDWFLALISGGHALDLSGLEQEARQSIGQESGPLWLLHWIGSGSPEGDPHSMAAVVGMCAHHTRADLFRGMLVSMACWTRQNLERMQATAGQTPAEMTLLGGVSRLRLLAELKASLLGIPVRISTIPEASAVGAALLAGLGIETYASPMEAVTSLQYPPLQIDPVRPWTDWINPIYLNAYLPLYPAVQPAHHALRSVSPPSA